MKKSIRVLLALAIAAMLSFGSISPAFADVDANGAIIGTEQNPAEAALTKVLQMPLLTDTPTASFSFEMTPVSLEGSIDPLDIAKMPTITITPLAFPGTGVVDVTTGIKIVRMESPDIFDGAGWTEAGIHIYTLTETANTYVPATGETMTYSGAEYTIEAHVYNGSSGGLYLGAITAKSTVIDYPGQVGGDKVDPSPGGTSTVLGDMSHMTFTNTFTKQNGGPDPADDALRVTKTVGGSLGNTNTLYFDYNMTLTQPSLVTGTPVYKAYVYDGTNFLVAADMGDNYTGTITDDSYGGYFEVTSGVAFSFSLKHGERLAFVGPHVGTTYDISEVGTINYVPTASVVVGSDTPVAYGTGSVAGDPLTIPTTLVGEGVNLNGVAFTNTYNASPVTGISVNDMPFALIIALAVGMLAAFVIVKARRRARNSE